MSRFSWIRFQALLIKEFVQMRRDRATFAMMVGVPVMQLFLFGFAINTDPKHLPAAVLSADNSPYARSFIRAMENSGYFHMVKQLSGEAEANRLASARRSAFSALARAAKVSMKAKVSGIMKLLVPAFLMA